MKRINLLTLVFLTSLWACEKTETVLPISEPVIEEPVFDLQWATRLDPNKEIVGSDMQQVYKEHFISFGDLDDPATIFGHNTSTGDLDWTYRYEGDDNLNIYFNYLKDNILVCVTGKRVFGFDLDMRSVLWEFRLDISNYFAGGGVIANGNFYLEADVGLGTADEVQHLLEIDIQTGEHNIALTLPPDSMGIKEISPPVFWDDLENNRQLMILNEYPNAQLPPQEATQNIMAIDVVTKEVVWKTENFTEKFYSNSIHPPVIYNNVVITGGDWSIYAFDTRTGEQLWRYKFNYHTGIWNTTNHLIHEDRLYVNNGQYDVTCLHPETGELIWNNPEGGPNCTDNMLYHDDMLVFTSWGYGSVMVLDALTGKTLHREHRYDDSSYNNDVVYDPETDMFFTSTYKHAVGFKIHKPK